MSEAEGLEAKSEETQEQEDKEQSATPEDIAAKSGWKPKDQFVASGGQEEEWRNAEVFNARGEWVSLEDRKDGEKRVNDRINQLESDFRQRIENVNKLHKAQLELQKSDLVRKRDDAIDNADREVANQYQNDIDSINTQQVTETAPPNNDNTILQQFNNQNPWIMAMDAKAAYAKQQFATYSAQGMDAEQSIAAMQADVGRSFPDVNPNRETQPVNEGGTKPGRKSKGRLSMSDLTPDEKQTRKLMPGAWANDKEFLQAVQYTRESEA